MTSAGQGKNYMSAYLLVLPVGSGLGEGTNGGLGGVGVVVGVVVEAVVDVVNGGVVVDVTEMPYKIADRKYIYISRSPCLCYINFNGQFITANRLAFTITVYGFVNICCFLHILHHKKLHPRHHCL